MSESHLKKRIKPLNNQPVNDNGECVVYLMSRDQRVQDNHSLIAAQKHALAKDLPLVVIFSLYKNSGYRTREHYDFMLEGLREVEKTVDSLNIGLHVIVGKHYGAIAEYINEVGCAVVYTDFSPLKGPRKLQALLADVLGCPLYVVDTHNSIPCWVASDKKEFSAATFRPKIHKYFGEFLTAPDDVQKHPYIFKKNRDGFKDVEKEVDTLLSALPTSGIKHGFKSGEKAAYDRLKGFIENELQEYAEKRNDPSNDALSDLSPYLHYGQLSSLRVALELQAIVNGAGSSLHLLESSKMPKAESFSNSKVSGAATLLEEMIVRKELSDNFCYYEENYTSVKGAHDWAQATIKEHDQDDREHIYSLVELEKAETHDDAWNAAQRQMMTTGKMHGYMRMYWAKKVKEWTPNAQTAIDILIELNDTYSIDGGDPNGYAGIMWSVCGVHDRAWVEREIFGKIRYMNYAGLKRKFDIDRYTKNI